MMCPTSARGKSGHDTTMGSQKCKERKMRSWTSALKTGTGRKIKVFVRPSFLLKALWACFSKQGPPCTRAKARLLQPIWQLSTYKTTRPQKEQKHQSTRSKVVVHSSVPFLERVPSRITRAFLVQAISTGGHTVHNLYGPSAPLVGGGILRVSKGGLLDTSKGTGAQAIFRLF